MSKEADKTDLLQEVREEVRGNRYEDTGGINPRYSMVFRTVSYVVFLGGVLLLPSLVNGLQLRLATLASIWFVATMGLQVLMGQAGLVSIGQAAFVGVGAYTAAILATKHGFSFLLTIPIAGISGVILAIIVGFPTLKLRGHYLAIASIGVGQIVLVLMVNWRAVTNGMDGITSIRRPVESNRMYFYITVAIGLAIAFALYSLRQTPVGLAFTALRTDETAAGAMGIPVAWHYLIAFMISGFCAGVAGALFAYNEGFISPYGFDLGQSILLLTMIIIGGLRHISGALVGAILLVFLPPNLEFLGSSYMLIYGFAVLLVILFAPDGAAGALLKLRNFLLRKISASTRKVETP
ncbi:MAG: branched-chain amino acid ABC transporter permease [Actinobacteria bacterium]|nr:branched-chain amino acid ABC transporter permease [Actinomycetota bacterium]